MGSVRYTGHDEVRNMNAPALTNIAILILAFWGFTLSVYIGHTHLLYISMQSIKAMHDQCAYLGRLICSSFDQAEERKAYLYADRKYPFERTLFCRFRTIDIDCQ
jgi:hypothetical protein